jgi:hypothetical protein
VKLARPTEAKGRPGLAHYQRNRKSSSRACASAVSSRGSAASVGQHLIPKFANATTWAGR